MINLFPEIERNVMGYLKSFCRKCSKSFDYNKNDNKRGIFCSIDCFKDSRNKKESKQCLFCFKHLLFYKRNDRKEQNCCSLSCRTKLKFKKLNDELNLKSYEQKKEIIKKRFENYIIKKDGCWEWKIAKVQGYGVFKFNRKMYKAHRISWELHFGEIPKDKFVLHKCNNKECSNPDHLYLGSYIENRIDLANSGTSKQKLLNKDQIIKIKKLLNIGVPCNRISKDFNIRYATILSLKKGKTWKEI